MLAEARPNVKVPVKAKEDDAVVDAAIANAVNGETNYAQRVRNRLVMTSVRQVKYAIVMTVAPNRLARATAVQA